MLTDQEIVFSTSPYPGLRSFLPNEADIFFGREEQIDELLKRLQGTRFLSVVGTSGCGKSSLVKAGMVPALEAGFLVQAGTHWCVAEMRPGEAPFNRLATSVLTSLCSVDTESLEPETVAFVQAALRRGPLGLVDVLRERGLPNRANLLLVIDQFEEIFRFHREGDADEADAFVNLLLASCAQSEFPVYVVLTMRSDFLGECALFEGLPQAMNNNQFLTPRLSRKECEAAIVKPARVFGGQVDPLLVNHLLNDMGSDFDQLPLLQHALMRMWELATDGKDEPAFGYDEGPTLQLADYKAIGGLKDALSLHADEVYGALDPKQKNIAEIMFRRLTERGIGKRDIRRPTQLGELAQVAEADVDDVKEIVEAFRRSDRSFLMPPPMIPLNQDTIIDIGHESLIRQWHRLNEWVTIEAESARIYQRLADDTVLYKQGKVAYLTDPELQIASDWYGSNQPNQAWANRYHPAEFSQVQSFLEASQADRERLQNEKERATQRLRALVIALGILASIMAGVILYAIIQSNDLNKAYLKIESQADSLKEQSDTLKSKNADLMQQKIIAVRNKDVADSLKEVALAQEKVTRKQNIQLVESKALLNLALKKQENLTAQAVASAKALRSNNIKDSTHLSGLIALEKGELDSAKKSFDTLLYLGNNSNLDNWWISYNLGSIYHKRADYKAAGTTYYKAISYLDEDARNTATERAITLYKVGQVYQDVGSMESAEHVYQMALDLLKNHAIKDTTDYRISIEINLADVQRELVYKKKDAIKNYSNVLGELRNKYGQGNARTLEVTDKLAQVYISVQSPKAYFEAEKLLKAEAGAIATKYGPDYYGLASVYRSLALVYDSTQSKKDTSSTLHQISQALTERNVKNAQEGELLEPLQRLYTAYNDEYAENLYKKELGFKRKEMPANSLQLAREITQFADFYASLPVPKYDEAKRLYTEDLNIREASFSGSYTKLTFVDSLRLQHTLESLGDILSRNSQKDSALLFYIRVNAFRYNIYSGQNHILTNNLKKIADLSKIEDAQKVYSEIIRIWQPLIGPQKNGGKYKKWDPKTWLKSQPYASRWYWLDPESYISSLESLGDILIKQGNGQGKRDEALNLYNKALQNLEWLAKTNTIYNLYRRNNGSLFEVYTSKYYNLNTRTYTPVFYQQVERIKEKLSRENVR